MSKMEIIYKIETLKEWESLIEAAKAEAEELRNSLKSELQVRGVEELAVGQYIIRNTPVLSNRFDSTSFKRIYGELYKAFTKQVHSSRFSIA